MKIKWGMFITEGRGKAGGSVASRNRTSAYVRNKTTPVNPQTLAQQAARSILASLSQAWRGLTQAQRDAWNAAVSQFSKTNVFGDTVNPTGKNLYTQLNINLSDIGQSSIDTPPTAGEVVEPSGLSLTVEDNGGTMSLAHDALDEDQTYKVFATEPLSPGIGFFKNRFRLIGTLAGSATSPADIASDYASKFGAVAAGQKVAVKLVPVVTATGQKGVGATTSAVAS